MLNLTVDEVLTTTRAVRKRLDFDRPVEMDVIRECLELALQAPTASNSQPWQWVVITDADKRAAIAEQYRKAWAGYLDMPVSAANVHAGDPAMTDIQNRVVSSAQYLADHFEKPPVLLIPVAAGRVDTQPNVMQASVFGSIIPAAWSFMLAARERGLGTCWTTLHLMYERECAEILGIPFEEFTQVACIPVAYTLGTDFRAAPRKDLDQFLHINGW